MTSRVIGPGIAHEGRRAIAEAISTVAAVERTSHAIVGEMYLPDPVPESARGRIACIAHHWNRRDEGVDAVVWHVRYDDTYTRTPDGWPIARRALTIDAIETRPVRRLRRGEPS